MNWLHSILAWFTIRSIETPVEWEPLPMDECAVPPAPAATLDSWPGLLPPSFWQAQEAIAEARRVFGGTYNPVGDIEDIWVGVRS